MLIIIDLFVSFASLPPTSQQYGMQLLRPLVKLIFYCCFLWSNSEYAGGFS